jgi:hypothetical protein
MACVCCPATRSGQALACHACSKPGVADRGLWLPRGYGPRLRVVQHDLVIIAARALPRVDMHHMRGEQHWRSGKGESACISAVCLVSSAVECSPHVAVQSRWFRPALVVLPCTINH